MWSFFADGLSFGRNVSSIQCGQKAKYWIKNLAIWSHWRHSYQCGPGLAKICHLSKHFKFFGNFSRVFLYLPQYFGDFLFYWANFHCCKWPNIEQIIYSSGHSDGIVIRIKSVHPIVQHDCALFFFLCCYPSSLKWNKNKAIYFNGVGRVCKKKFIPKLSFVWDVGALFFISFLFHIFLPLSLNYCSFS